MKNCRDCIHCTDKGGHLACDYPAMCFQGDGKGNYDKVGFKPKKTKVMEANEIISRIRQACDTIYEKYEGNPLIEKDDILEPFEDIINDYYEDLKPM